MSSTATIRPLIETLDTLGESVQVDREAGIIRGVKLLGLTSKNNRDYTPAAIRQAVPLYEGMVCNVDHRAKPGESRTCRDRFGEFRGVEQRTDGALYGDLHFLKSHPLADLVCEAAERRLKTYGMSHDARGVSRDVNGRTVIEQIKSVASVDLVADPATTRGLFEHTEPDMSADLQEQVTKLVADVTKLTADLAAEQAKSRALQEQVDAANQAKADADRKAGIAAAFAEHKIDRAKVPAGLLSVIESQTVEKAVEAIKGLAEQRGRPQSSFASPQAGAQPAAGEVTDGKSLARKLRA